jgi:hypothetical protein
LKPLYIDLYQSYFLSLFFQLFFDNCLKVAKKAVAKPKFWFPNVVKSSRIEDKLPNTATVTLLISQSNVNVIGYVFVYSDRLVIKVILTLLLGNCYKQMKY